ncbi:MAG TPA: hypothetical protein PLQ12_00675 [Candidatus Defluviicoccus seviourii]|nr:hypothetical protein [Candidatus Defluviicoccus seviourii]
MASGNAAFREHAIRDDEDYAAHMDYVHFNPVKHGLVAAAADWPYSTFKACAARGAYPKTWGGDGVADVDAGERGRKHRPSDYAPFIRPTRSLFWPGNLLYYCGCYDHELCHRNIRARRSQWPGIKARVGRERSMVVVVVVDKLWISHRARKRPKSAFAIKGFHRVRDYPAERPAQLKRLTQMAMLNPFFASDYPAERPAQLKRVEEQLA